MKLLHIGICYRSPANMRLLKYQVAKNTPLDKMQYLDYCVRFLYLNFLIYMGEILPLFILKFLNKLF